MTAARRAPWPWASLHLAFGLSGVVLIAVAQLYAFTEMSIYAVRLGGYQATLIILFASSFLIFTTVSLVRIVPMMLFAYFDATGAVFGNPSRLPRVSILVPAHDEAERIERALQAIVALDYPEVEAIVVDDGSTDDTFVRAKRFADEKGAGRVKVLRKPNGGKWSALNLAFQHAAGDLVVCVDADSHLTRDSLSWLVPHFEDPRVGACAGQVAVRNDDRVLTRFQSLEYVVMNGLLRRMQSFFGMVLVAPGPVSMFRRQTLDEINQRFCGGHGPWESDTFAEDADLSLNVLLTGQRLVYEARAVSLTTVPATTFALLNQRYRWTRGNLQAALKAWRRWKREPTAPRLLPLWLGVQLFETIVWPLVNLYGILAFGLFVALFGVEGPIIMWFVALTVLDTNMAALSIRLERASFRLLLLAPLNRIYYSVLLDVSKLFSLYDELRNTRMRWS
jgi:cellulose synthase/poly-beta-1,6-N-acetylglucosamine synthase-like glycosyltransferase